ncbi:MAG: DNA mismatch repair endonuclease MutL [Lachnospiraceae bacterium]|nr:DNA mismatch repair endonuclease MutL [Lachnospiraceae bacterium]
MIRILDNNTINKIAAGEVIEKPVNVVKELVENSIDAGAAHISVEIKGGGIDYIRVTDDGSGIPYEEVPTAFLRHATSKIVTSEDLFFLNTLGFRGEALASIASVSHTEMITKVSDELMGTKITLDCGSVIEMIKTGSPDGTTIIVRDLFFNVPARKKFLNTPGAEGTKIIELMEELALSNPSVAFQLIVNGSVKVQTNGAGNIKDIIFRIFGKEIHDNLLKLDYEDEFIRIMGYITKPSVCRPSRSGENYFINGRYVKNDYVTRGIEEGYRGFLMQHQFPFVVLYIELDPFGIDINVHPAKSEVKITNGEFLVEILNKTINKALSENELIPDAFKPKEDKEKLERAPEPFEKKLIKGEHVVQKGYESKIKTEKQLADEDEALNKEKSGEFTIEFSDSAPTGESAPKGKFMNNITTIDYKSKYNKLEERMKLGVDEDDEENVSDLSDTQSEKPEVQSAQVKEETAKETVKEEASKLEFRKAEPKEYPNSPYKEGAAATSTGVVFTKASSFVENKEYKDEPVHSVMDQMRETQTLKEDEAVKEDTVKTDVQADEVVKTDEKTETSVENETENTASENAVSEEIKEEAVEEAGNPFEEWLNSIENKDESELEKENSGLIVKLSDIEKNAVKEDDDANDAFNEFDLEKKLDIIDKIPENESEASEDRLKSSADKYSVLNDDIEPINLEEVEFKQNDNRSVFRVKDFSKNEEETSAPVKENVENIFKKVDRFNTSSKNVKPKETQSVLFTEKTLDPSKLSKFKIIDQIFDTYWLILVENELLIMDQHAAHEKVLYEKFMDKFKNNKIETQTLMLSQVVNLSRSEMDVYLRYKKEFEKFGFIINDFGDRDLFIRGIPTDLFGTDAKSLFTEILSELINVSPSLHIDVIETRIATRACKAAIKGNQKMSKEDCKKLIEYMLTLKNPYQCPHGRPTLIRITKSDLEKMFKRIVS